MKRKILSLVSLAMAVSLSAFGQNYTVSKPDDAALGGGSSVSSKNVDALRAQIEQLVVVADTPVAAASFADGVSNTSTTFTSATAAFVAGDVGKAVTGAKNFVFADGVTTSGSPTVTSATASFRAADVGKAIAGTGIPTNAYIGQVNSATSIGMSSFPGENRSYGATASGTGVSVTITNRLVVPAGATVASVTNGTTVVLSAATFYTVSAVPFTIARAGTGMVIPTVKGKSFVLPLTGNRAVSFDRHVSGAEYTVLLQQDGTGSRTVTWNAAIHWPGGTAPTLTTGAGKIDKITFFDTGVYWLGLSSGLNY